MATKYPSFFFFYIRTSVDYSNFHLHSFLKLLTQKTKIISSQTILQFNSTPCVSKNPLFLITFLSFVSETSHTVTTVFPFPSVCKWLFTLSPSPGQCLPCPLHIIAVDDLHYALCKATAAQNSVCVLFFLAPNSVILFHLECSIATSNSTVPNQIYDPEI